MLKELGQVIKDNGGTAFLVGGAVRDELLGIPSKDHDVEVHGMEEQKLMEVLMIFTCRHEGKMSVVGKSFKVIKLRFGGDEIDISLPRRDRKVAAGHKGFEVSADPFMGAKEACSRRDFSFNAIMKQLDTGRIVDPFNGLKDLKNKVIRMVSPTAFSEDSLRVLRALQFAGRFGFKIEENTMDEMKKVDLSDLPAERVFGELEKLLLKSKTPSLGFTMQLWPFPELNVLEGVEQDPEWHPEGDVWVHTMKVLNEAAKHLRHNENLSHEEQLTVMLAALCHDFGKASTTAVLDGRVRAHGHSEAGLEPTERFLDRLNVHTVNGFDVRGQVLALVETHLSPPQLRREFEKGSFNISRALRRLSRKVRLDLLAIVSLADMLGRDVSLAEKEKSRETFRWFVEESQKCGVEKKEPERILKGRHLIALGFKPGPGMGKLLDKAFDLQLDGEITTFDDAIRWLHDGGTREQRDFEDFEMPSLMSISL